MLVTTTMIQIANPITIMDLYHSPEFSEETAKTYKHQKIQIKSSVKIPSGTLKQGLNLLLLYPKDLLDFLKQNNPVLIFKLDSLNLDWSPRGSETWKQIDLFNTALFSFIQNYSKDPIYDLGVEKEIVQVPLSYCNKDDFQVFNPISNSFLSIQSGIQKAASNDLNFAENSFFFFGLFLSDQSLESSFNEQMILSFSLSVELWMYKIIEH